MADKIKLLVVDDEELVCHYIERRFRRKGFEVLFALSGEEALVAFEKEKPDILILDIMMKGIDGLETIKRIKERYDLPKTIIVSALDNQEKIEELKKIGVSDYLIKPILLRELDNLVMSFAKAPKARLR
ncbi:MAG: response regulator [Candidatus Omnitrophota bacterium]|nr:response regulator [Candidatus Omnitrophota bacterium]